MRITRNTLYLAVVLVAMYSCVSIRKQIDKTGTRSNVSQTARKRIPTSNVEQNANGTNITKVIRDSVTTYITDVEIDDSGEYMSKINIDEIVVTSTLKSIPERFGFISIDFVVTVPKEFQHKQWSIKLTPVVNQRDTSFRLDPVVLRGETMDLLQKRQHWQQQKFQKRVDFATNYVKDTVIKNLITYNDRQQFFRDKDLNYNLKIYDRRVEFFDNRSHGHSQLYADRMEHFGTRGSKSTSGKRIGVQHATEQNINSNNVGKGHAESYMSFFGWERNPDVVARNERYLARQQQQSLTYDQAKERYDKTIFENARLESRMLALKERSAEFVSHPRIKEARMDSLVSSPHNIKYFYSQDLRTDEHTSRMTLTLNGLANDIRGRKATLPPSDTLTYTIASMISFIDYTPRYVYKIVEKYATVNDRSWITYPIGKSKLIDTLANNKVELDKMTKLMNSLLYQYEFYVDSVILTAASSPEGRVKHNENLSKDRAHSLYDYLTNTFNKDIDTILKVRWIGEDWNRLTSLIKNDSRIENRAKILNIINDTHDADRREHQIANQFPIDFKLIKEELYPQLRSVSFKYSLRRVGMIQDTVYTTVLDSAYLNGIQMLEKRNYKGALRILEPYKDINSAITLMSLGYDKEALEIMETTPQTAKRDYMLAILCARQGNIPKGLYYFDMACKAEPTFEYRANLDPEIQILIRNRPK